MSSEAGIERPSAEGILSPSITRVLLGLIVLLAIVLGFMNMGAIGMGNEYYTAAVKSMLMSGKNFFFLAAEPGGSVSVDKPPLGLWLQALSAFILGVNGPAVVLPQVLAGIASVPLLYHLVRRTYGKGAGLLAALILAISPITVAAMHDNIIDPILAFILLMAAWAFLKASEQGRWRWLLAGSLLVGLGFNTKMLEAFLPLPAFLIVYLAGSPESWKRKLAGLSLAVPVILVVSFSWAILVDRTPASQRPFVGGTARNSEIGLAVGYNGVSRILGEPGPDAGQPGPLRLFVYPLSKDIGWLLPAGLCAVVFLAASILQSGDQRWQNLLPLSDQSRGFMLWGVWLLGDAAFFSVASFIHGYYLVLLAPALAAILAIGTHELWSSQLPRRAWLLLALMVIAILAYQALIALHTTSSLAVLFLLLIAALACFGFIALPGRVRKRFPVEASMTGSAIGMTALLALPLVWSILTALNPRPDVVLPAAYNAYHPAPIVNQVKASPALLSYLEKRTQGIEYLVAVPNAVLGAPYILATGRPVLYIGGFTGTDSIITPESLAALVKAGRLRYVWDLGTLSSQRPGISQWLEKSCRVAPDAPLPPRDIASIPQGHFQLNPQVLYDCSP